MLVVFTCALGALAAPKSSTSSTVVSTSVTPSGNTLIPATTTDTAVFTDTTSAVLVSVTSIVSTSSDSVSTTAETPTTGTGATLIPATTETSAILFPTTVTSSVTSASAAVTTTTSTKSGASRAAVGGMTIAALVGAGALILSVL
ncbi:hypothetical protein FRB96_002347 [Tulasnella sp. 330]|nr:hypothetical protein FRB96_002347 [Tulasnella sp. 330]KAG8879198.1 hypothetical protein FRB97_001865 [Tulasnella sp. 331]KAG8885227.1 hypothetical protein FRB98_001909 [Tulasnella sp. 332]